MTKYLYNIIQNEQGSFLIMTTFALGLFSTLAIGFLLLATTDLRISSLDAWTRQAEYVAKAGIHESIYQLSLDKNWDEGFTDVVLSSDQTYSVTVTNSSPTITLISSGTANGYSKTIEANLSISELKSNGKYRIRVNTWELQ